MSDSKDRREEDSPARPRRRWGRRIAVTALVFVLLIVAGIWGAGRRTRSGLAGEMAKYRAAGEPATVEELNRWPGLRTGEGENAVPLLRAAASMCNMGGAAWKAGTDALQAPPLSEAERAAIEALVAANAEALAKLDEACAAPRIDWDPQYKSPIMGIVQPFGDLSEQRGLVQLAHAAALAAHARGDDAEALRRIGQMTFVGRAVAYQPGLVPHLVGIGCDLAACRAATNLGPELKIGAGSGAATPGQVRQLLDAMRDERPPAEAQRRALVSERVSVLDFPNAVGRPGPGGGGPIGFNVQVPGLASIGRALMVDNSRVMARYVTVLMEAVAVHPDLPSYKVAMAATDPMPEATESPRRYATARVLAPSLDRAIETHYRFLADRRLAATCLAVRLYAVDHGGKLPETLEALVPSYLPAVPVDPLAAGGVTLRYVNERTDPQRPRVYSVGVDGTDDGGVEPPENARGGGAARSDVVRHVKRQPRPTTAK